MVSVVDCPLFPGHLLALDSLGRTRFSQTNAGLAHCDGLGQDSPRGYVVHCTIVPRLRSQSRGVACCYPERLRGASPTSEMSDGADTGRMARTMSYRSHTRLSSRWTVAVREQAARLGAGEAPSHQPRRPSSPPTGARPTAQLHWLNQTSQPSSASPRLPSVPRSPPVASAHASRLQSSPAKSPAKGKQAAQPAEESFYKLETTKKKKGDSASPSGTKK